MNIENNEIIEAIGKSVVESILKKSIIPYIQSELTRYVKGNELRTLIESINYYCCQKKEKYSIIDTIVFPNQQTLFDTIYQPLTLTEKEPKYGNNTDVELVNKYPKEIIEEYERIIIIDTAGMGKSTITKKIFLCAIQEQTKIPIYIEVRNLNANNTIQKEIYKQLEIGKRFLISDSLLDWFLLQSNCIYIFDGLDEIAVNNRESVIKQLHDFIEQHSNTEIIITSRPEDIVLSFGSFQQFNIKPLSQQESSELVKRYDTYSHISIAEPLLKAIAIKENHDIQAFLQIPFLLSLVYKCFEYKKDIPLKKSLFYKQVYDALFESHDLSKPGYFIREKYSQLSLDEFDRVLRHVAYFSSQENEVEYSNDKIVAYIDQSKPYMGDLQFQSSKFLQDLLQTVPLFRQDGLNVKWAHKSIQDYFTAKFIWLDVKDKQANILEAIYNSNKLSSAINTLDLYEELDPMGFSLTIAYWFNWELLEFWKKIQPISIDESEQKSKFKIFLFFNTPYFYCSTSKFKLPQETKDTWDKDEAAILKKIRKIDPTLDDNYIAARYDKDNVRMMLVFWQHPIRGVLKSLLIRKKYLKAITIDKFDESIDNFITVAPKDRLFSGDEIFSSIFDIIDLEWLLNAPFVYGIPDIIECERKLRELEIWRDKTLNDNLLNW
jgi:predicted NACHT family NTPase